MRLFVALDVGNDIKDYLFNLKRSINNSNAKINWVAKKNLHLTLKFIGEVPDSDVAKIKAALKNIKFGRFKLSLKSLGVFPNENFLRVLWVGLEPESYVIKLQKLIDEALIVYGKQETEFKCHLTIGRIKVVKDRKRFLGTIRKIKIGELSSNINNFRLYKSTLTKDGPIYEVLEAYYLE